MRKITFLFIALLLLPLFSFSQKVNKNIRFIPESEVPIAVLEQQQALFPSNFLSRWQVQQADAIDTTNVRYIANVEKDGRPGFSSSYLPNGIPLFTSEIISKEIIPENLRLEVKKEYPKFKIETSNLITLSFPQQIIYMVKLRDDNRLQYAFYNTSGTEIKRNRLPPEMLFLIE